MAEYPRKKFYRQRAHSNPIADHDFDVPTSPANVDWKSLYPQWDGTKRVEMLDVGCGYGGMLIELARRYPESLCLGMEIRVKVSDFVRDRILALRARAKAQRNSQEAVPMQHQSEAATEASTDAKMKTSTVDEMDVGERLEHNYENVACVRTNTMKYLANWCERASLSKMFFLFPDPHFKKGKRRWRILNRQLLAEYAFVLRVGGVLYTATDVRELHEWMVERLSRFPLFERLNEQETLSDPLHVVVAQCSEEAQKVARAGGDKYVALFRRIADPFLCPPLPLAVSAPLDMESDCNTDDACRRAAAQ